MKNKKTVNIIPTKDEVKEILAQIFQAQTDHIIQGTWKSENIQNAPILLVQAWFGQMMLKAFDKISSVRWTPKFGQVVKVDSCS